MPSTRFLALAALFISASASTIVPPAQRGTPWSPTAEVTHLMTDMDSVVSTISSVNQKTGASAEAAPSDDVPPVAVTALDGTALNATVADVTSSTSTRRRSSPLLAREPAEPFVKRTRSYTQVFSGQAPGVEDAYVDGTAYLTYKLVNNGTYNVQECLDFCDSVDGCQFVNLYYEFNNPLLDFLFPQLSNLKCAAYADFHNATEKTNKGGIHPTNPFGIVGLPTKIGQSGGWACTEESNPPTPTGYDLVFGPTNGANNAPGYMGFAFLDRYDVQACADLCNSRGYDPVGGVCQYFNIWRAVVKGTPTTYTCSMYYIPADASSATNTGQGDLAVTLSRGYQRKTVVVDGGFEGFGCADDFCFAASYANWIGTTPTGGDLDATIFYFTTYAHTGHSSALLGAANGDDSLSGSISPAKALSTTKGANYVIQVFVANNFSDDVSEAGAFVDVFWNGKKVGSVVGYQGYTPAQFNVVGTGKDTLTFTGAGAPAWSFIDDVFVALL
ncbi:hypothetical protein FB45DRAFT_895035 [Roridomyces roridus]|uniref:Fruit-body specific protein a n=1 Tax=Roridomyces roridus TaxID=1738132 RepID=A0AAD7CGG6_9AGAR|nr:hypothetical protein FB45DRAFT_895035 [Roridomyces roridus]